MGTANTFGRLSPSIIYNYIKAIPIHSLRQIRALSEGEQTFHREITVVAQKQVRDTT